MSEDLIQDTRIIRVTANGVLVATLGVPDDLAKLGRESFCVLCNGLRKLIDDLFSYGICFAY